MRKLLWIVVVVLMMSTLNAQERPTVSPEKRLKFDLEFLSFQVSVLTDTVLTLRDDNERLQKQNEELQKENARLKAQLSEQE